MDERQLRKKHDRELIELLNELRVALPGVQVLFAFLLVVPFSSRFDVDRTEKVAYMIALLATVVGTILLMAPSAYHRLRWREKNKERMLRTSNRLAIGASPRSPSRSRPRSSSSPTCCCRAAGRPSSPPWPPSGSRSPGSRCRSPSRTTAGTTKSPSARTGREED